MAGAESIAELKHSARLGKIFSVRCMVGVWLGGGERLRIRLKLSIALILSLVSAELQHSARLGKTFPGGWGKAGKKANLSQLELEIG